MKLIETVAAIQTSRAAVTGAPGGAQTGVPVSSPKREAVTDIGPRRRQRRDDDDDPSLPM